MIAEIETRLAQRRVDDGIALAEAQLEREPDAIGLHYALGTLWAAKNEYRRSAEHFREEIERNPAHFDSHVRLAAVLSDLGDREDAISILRRVLEREPRNAEATLLLASALKATGSPADAEKILSDGAEWIGAAAWVELGALYEERGENERAETALRRALAIEPDHAEAIFQLGRNLIRQGKEEEGQRFLGRQSELELRADRRELLQHRAVEDGGEAEDFVALGRYELLQGKPAPAIEAFRRALERDAANEAATVGVGQALLESGRTDEAKDWLTRAVERFPASAAAHFYLGLTRHLGADFAGAQQALGRSRELAAWTGREYLFLGNVLASTGVLADAELAFRESLKVGPEIPEAHYKLGLVLHARARSADARPELERFVELEPRDPRGALLLGVVLNHTGDVAAAEAKFRQAIDRLGVIEPDPAALDALIADLRPLPGGPEAAARLAAIRAEETPSTP